MTQIEQEWSKVKSQTSWSIMPCLSYLDNDTVSEKPSPEHDNCPIVNNNANAREMWTYTKQLLKPLVCQQVMWNIVMHNNNLS